MNLMVKFFCFLLFFILLSCQQEKKVNFEVKFPKENAKVEKSTVNLPGLVDHPVTILRLDDNQEESYAFYSLYHTRIPNNLKAILQTTPDAPDLLVKTLLSSLLTGSEVFDCEIKDILHMTHQGYEIHCAAFEGYGFVKGRGFKIDNSLFFLYAGGEEGSEESVDKFLNSFRIKKEK
ncbi:hypothetical protein LJB94_01085 [Odoribacter sp. OttesenSCG-928-G04]|nr:hypothetical protein [Odoribacter sp. OttesenSCG-928-G04]MDL2331132.1 hypothetical protein [Odoribacter sp. OttesenSCG-928-A06]